MSGIDNQMTITKTIVVVTAVSQTLIGPNPSRKYLMWMVIGPQDVAIRPAGAAASMASDVIYEGAGSGNQGGSQEFSQHAPTNGFNCISDAVGSSVVVWEGA